MEPCKIAMLVSGLVIGAICCGRLGYWDLRGVPISKLLGYAQDYGVRKTMIMMVTKAIDERVVS